MNTSTLAEAAVLERLLNQNSAGRRVCVPVLGSGVNIQAARIDGLEIGDDWEGLLRKVAGKIQLSRNAFESLPKSNLAKWETMLRQCAIAKGIDPYRAENELQKLICTELRKQEASTKGCTLYGEFLHARFWDIISLNFDRRLALHSGREDFRTAPQRRGVRAADDAIYRHSIVTHEDGTKTRIWYPHGDTKKTATLKFGVRKYGDYIASLERQRKSLMASWSESTEAGQDALLPPGQFDAMVRCCEPRHWRLTWPWLLLLSPIAFIGCSLAFDEWPLWWLLHQRARVFSRFKQGSHPPTVFLCVGDVPDNLQGSPCDLVVLRFPSFDKLWFTIRRALK